MATLYYNDARYSLSSRDIQNFTFAVFNDTDYISKLNLSMSFEVKILKFIGYIDWKGSSQSRTKDYETTIIKQTVDTVVSKGVLGNFLVKMIYDNIMKYSNYKFDCPQEKGHFYAYNYPIMDLKYIPSGFLGGIKSWELNLVVKGKTAASKSLQQMFTLQFYGQVGN